MKNIILCLFLGLCLVTTTVGQEEEITVGTMDVVKNLNPYLAESEIELAIQKVAFPPLIADFIEQNSGRRDSFRGLLIDESRNIRKGRGANHLDFFLENNPVTPEIFIDNFNRVRRLGAKSKFSWNLRAAQDLKTGWVRAFFKGNYPLCKLIAASFPLVDFGSIEKTWRRSDQVFIINSDLKMLKGFSNYRYDDINHRRATVRLAPARGRGKTLLVKSFPDYSQMIDRLNAGELHVAFNLSALSHIHSKDIELDDMKFANQYVLYMAVTSRGKRKGLGNMSIIKHIRLEYNRSFAADTFLKKSGNIFLKNGFLVERLSLSEETKPKGSGPVTLLYIRNTINDRVVDIVEGILQNMGYNFRAVAIDQNTSRENIDENEFDLLLKSTFIQFPEFINLKHYKKYIAANSPLHNRYIREINRLLTSGGTLDHLEGEAQTLEKELLQNFPIVFFLRYNTRIAVRKNIQNYESDKGVPYFFYNLSNW